MEVIGQNAFASVIAPPSGTDTHFLLWVVGVLFYIYPVNFTALSIILELKSMFVVYLDISHAHFEKS